MQLIKENLNEKLYYKKLDSGLEVYVMPKPYFAKKYVFFGVPFGGIHTKMALKGDTHTLPLGLAHFLEHQVFENKENPTFQQFEKIGANVNAYTSNQMTVYHFECVDHLKEGLSILMDMVMHARIDEASVSKEKKVIQQEIKMYQDDIYWEIDSALKRAMYESHPIREDIAGTIESVEKTTLEDLKFYYDTLYTPGNMKLFVYGDVDKDTVCEWVETFQTEHYRQKNSHFNWVMPQEGLGIHKKEVVLKREVGQDKILMGFKNDPFENSMLKAKQIAAIRLANGMMFGDSSNLFQSMYEKGWLHDPVSSDVQYGLGYAKCVLGAETDYSDALMDAIYKTIEHHKTHGFTEQDFLRNKKKLIGRFVFSFNSLQSIAGNLTYNIMRGEDLFAVLDAYKSLNLDDLTKAVNQFYNFDRMSYAKLTKE